MKFCWCTLHVSDMEQSIEFYTKAVGLKVIRRFEVGPVREIAFLGFGEGSDETQVELIYNKNGPEHHASDQISLGFNVDSIEAQQSLLTEMGIMGQSEVMKPSPHIQFFYAEDPDGLKVQFVESLG